MKGKGLDDPDAQLRGASAFAFHNTSRYDFEKLLADAPHLAANLRNCFEALNENPGEHFTPRDVVSTKIPEEVLDAINTAG